MAARKGSLEILALFTELVTDPKSSVKIKLLKRIIECEEERDATVEAFKQQLGSISEARSLKQSGELISYMPDLTCIIASKKSSKGARQKRFSGFCPLRGGGYPPNSAKEKILLLFTLIFR